MSVGYIEDLLHDQNFFAPPDKRSKIVCGMEKGKPIHPSRPSNKVFQNRKKNHNEHHALRLFRQDHYLSVDTKGLAAILCSFGKEAFELSELNKLLKDNISDERIFRTLMELYDMCYLDVWEEGDNRHLMLRGM